MVMNPVDNSPHLRQAVINGLQGILRRQRGACGEAVRRSGRPAASLDPADRVEITETAHQPVALRQTLETGRAATAKEPDMREDKLAKVRERLAQGYYNSVEVRDKVAGGVDQVIETMKKL